MTDVIGVKFCDSSRIYYFLLNGLDLKKGIDVIVDTEKGHQFGKIVTDVISVDPEKIVAPLRNVVRIATDDDIKQNDKNIKDSNQALLKAKEFVSSLNLDMNILSASFTFDRKQLLFNFIADERVDFRELAKKLAGLYKTRIELRQIGVRDKAKEIGGIGQCGRGLCCSSFLKDINSVSINMAKNQNLALNPQKINGVCGRLMCCLSYENENYFTYKKGLPKAGDVVETEKGKGKVIYLDIFKRLYKVELSDGTIVDVEK